MISGFNTDIEFDGTVYHVQTEDKGLDVRLIISLVYDRGTILASKRASYEDLAIKNFDEKVLSDRVGRQHKLICAAVRAGRIEELKEMTATAKARSKAPAAVESVSANGQSPVAVAEMPYSAPMPVTIAKVDPVSIETFDPPIVAPPIPAPVIGFSPAPFDPSFDEPVIDAHIIDEIFLPDEAVEVVSELSGTQRPANNKLSLELLGDTKFKGGEKRTVSLMICRGTDRKVISGAQIMVKVLGSSFRPVIFHAKSDANGLAKIHLQMPSFRAGRAAVLIRALSGGEEVELRRIVTPG